MRHELWWSLCRTGRVHHDLRNENLFSFHWEKIFSVVPDIHYEKTMSSYAAKMKNFFLGTAARVVVFSLQNWTSTTLFAQRAPLQLPLGEVIFGCSQYA